MIASQDSIQNGDSLPRSKRVYVPGSVHPQIRVPFREIEQQSTTSFNGDIEVNEPVRVYDCSGPWGDASFEGDVEQGLPSHRGEWIRQRGDVEEYDGRQVKPEDNGYLTEGHAEYASRRESKNRLQPFPGLKRRPLRAKYPSLFPSGLNFRESGAISS